MIDESKFIGAQDALRRRYGEFRVIVEWEDESGFLLDRPWIFTRDHLIFLPLWQPLWDEPKVIYSREDAAIMLLHGLLGYPHGAPPRVDSGVVRWMENLPWRFRCDIRLVSADMRDSIAEYRGTLTRGLMVFDLNSGKTYALVHPLDDVRGKMKEIAKQIVSQSYTPD